MAASTAVATTTTACLNDQEWERSIWMMEMGPQERADQQCLMEVLSRTGGDGSGDEGGAGGNPSSLTNAGAECGLDMGPPTGQAPSIPPPTPTATPEATRAPVVTPTQEPTQAPTLPPAVHHSGNIITPLNPERPPSSTVPTVRNPN